MNGDNELDWPKIIKTPITISIMTIGIMILLDIKLILFHHNTNIGTKNSPRGAVDNLLLKLA